MPVEAGHILAFRRAIGIADAELDLDAIAPATFLAVADHFDPLFERRPRPGAARREHHGLFHVEQRFDYARQVHAGETLTARRLAPRRWHKQGRRAGQLEFIEVTTEFTDAHGAPVASVAWVDVQTERSHASLTAEQGADTATAGGRPVGTVLVEDLSRTQLVMYVGAAGDFDPLHHDEVYAHNQGYRSVFAPGMLTMALTARGITERIGDARLSSLVSRFRAQVWPGDTLVARFTETSPHELSVETVNQHGAVVLDTVATIRAEG
jgi:acyl dehydratase